MTEFAHKPELKLSEYSEFVTSSRFAEESDADWRDKYAQFIEGEMLEFMVQHGNSSMLLYPDEMGVDRSTAPPELRFNMADEMGDSLWFSFDIAERAGLKINDCVKDSLQRFAPDEDIPAITDFSDIESLAIKYADAIEFVNKRSFFEIEDIRIATSLKDSPHYAMMRSVMRLSRSIAPARFDSIAGPPSAASLEVMAELDLALGDYMLVLAYIAKQRLDIPFEDIAQFNKNKLRHRRIHGKENDIHFSQENITQ